MAFVQSLVLTLTDIFNDKPRNTKTSQIGILTIIPTNKRSLGYQVNYDILVILKLIQTHQPAYSLLYISS